MTISSPNFTRLQDGIKSVDDLRVRGPINTALAWLGGSLITQLNAAFNALPTYVTGNFTPVLSFGGASVGITYTAQTGTYTRIGNKAFIEIVILLSSKGVSVGSMSIAGLPFTVSSTCAAPVQINTFTAGVGDTHLQAVFTGAATTMTVHQITAGAGTLAILADTDFTNTSLLRIAGAYTI
jgi:hypothetical protein